MHTGDLNISHFIEQNIGGFKVIVDDRQPPSVIIAQHDIVVVAVVIVFNNVDISTGRSTGRIAASAAICEGLVQIAQAAHYLHEYGPRIFFW